MARDAFLAGRVMPKKITPAEQVERHDCPKCQARTNQLDRQASGVLLRAGEITEGAELARTRRLSARNDKELAKGPARLATALGVGRALDGTDACARGRDAVACPHRHPGALRPGTQWSAYGCRR
ncbi:hypothetical protein GCM10022206_39360 [Streptomyces chiangmaiensis]